MSGITSTNLALRIYKHQQQPAHIFTYQTSSTTTKTTPSRTRTHNNGYRRHMVHVIVPLCSQSTGKQHNQHTVSYLECSRLAKEGSRETVKWTDNHRKYKKPILHKLNTYITSTLQHWCVLHVYFSMSREFHIVEDVDLFWLDILLAFMSSANIHACRW